MSYSTLEEKSLKVLETLKKREADRQNMLERNIKEKEAHTSAAENLELFQSVFNEQLHVIENKLASSPSLEAALMPKHYDALSKDVLQLQKYVSSCSIFLRTYDIKTCSEKLQQLNTKLKNSEETLLPKKKFGFKKRKVVIATDQDIDIVDTSKHEEELDPQRRGVTTYDFYDLTDEKVMLRGDSLKNRDVSISKLTNCFVYLLGNPSTVTINDVKNTTIVCGPVSTSMFVNGCDNSNIVVACQQLRLHSTYNTNIYLHVTSKAIIEGCTDLRVAPYNLVYIGINADYDNAKLNRNRNNWDRLDDFEWLSSAKHSPNWSIIPLENRVESWFEEAEEEEKGEVQIWENQVNLDVL